MLDGVELFHQHGVIFLYQPDHGHDLQRRLLHHEQITYPFVECRHQVASVGIFLYQQRVFVSFQHGRAFVLLRLQFFQTQPPGGNIQS